MNNPDTLKASRCEGSRPGSGRPRKPPEELKTNATLRLTPRAADYLRAHRKQIQAEIEAKAHADQ